jgi:hypothetical protein
MNRALVWCCALLVAEMLFSAGSLKCAETAVGPPEAAAPAARPAAAGAIQVAKSEPLAKVTPEPNEAGPQGPSRSGKAALERALQSPTKMEFEGLQFREAIEFLKDLHKIEIQLDHKALSDAGFDPDKQVDKRLLGVTLESALNLLLREHDLAWTIANEVLLITTKEQEQNLQMTRLYDVADLVTCRDSKDKVWDDYDTLIELVTAGIDPRDWDSVGGPNQVKAGTLGSGKILLVRASYGVQRKVADLLKEIRAVGDKQTVGGELPRRDKPEKPATPATTFPPPAKTAGAPPPAAT